MLYAFTLWRLWLARNEQVYRQKQQTPEQTVSIILTMLEEYKWEQNHIIPLHPDDDSAQKKKIQDQQEPPPPNWIKINTDGAVKGNPGPAGTGCVCRDNTGKIILIIAAPLGIASAIVAETWGLLMAARIAT
ncbi:uncharacterized protein LOC113311208 [Papaver somniferum]|uniref:uncharacterized protein LOC113311208 n=1 Tax=Papaver somniferum TaxID=3469 RepID=UPI000E6F8DE8|nr:uncharacterized protein LOC113311208 [Papaver somniferum]